MNRVLIGAAIGLVMVLAGCTTGAAQATGPMSVEIVVTDTGFTPNRVDVRVHQTLTIHLVNRGGQPHDLTFPSLHMPGLAGQEAQVAPGGTATLTLRFDAPGVHSFVDSLPGHAAMQGAVFVSP